MNTTFTLYSDGRLSAVTGTWSMRKCCGFTGGVQIVLTDKKGYPIWNSVLRKYGVYGRAIGRSKRDDAWQERVPQSVINRIGGYAIIQQHNPRPKIWDTVEGRKFIIRQLIKL